MEKEESQLPGVNILVLNCGSSSLKYRIIHMPGEIELVQGEAQRVGIKTDEPSKITHITHGNKRVIEGNLPDHVSAFKKAMELIREDEQTYPDVYIDCFGHRYVNGGRAYSKTTRINSKDLENLRATIGLAPLHNPMIFGVVEECAKNYKDKPQYIVIDSAFLSTIPEENATYALPLKMTQKLGLNKIGFHGISYQYVMQQGCKFLNRKAEDLKIVATNLGTGGASVCAIKNGVVIDSSMGFTPLEGLVMNTRSGDVDIALMFYLMFSNKMSTLDSERLFNKKSGVLSIFKHSSDLRDALNQISHEKNAERAFNMFVNRARRYIGYCSLLLQKPDVLIFTDSLGVEVPKVRESICKGLECLGLEIDEQLNNAYDGGAADISKKGSHTRILVIPTNEEIMIARETYKQIEHDHSN